MSKISNSPATVAKPASRPLSPHLGRYYWSLTMATSILHRATGVFLTAGLVMICWWILAVTSLREEAFSQFYDFLRTDLGRLLAFGWRFSLAFHICNGLRHLVWDIGYGFKPATARNASLAVILASLLLTGLFYWVTLIRWYQLY